jgi:hypothetical protein
MKKSFVPTVLRECFDQQYDATWRVLVTYIPPPAILWLVLLNPPGRKDLRKAYFLGQGSSLGLKLNGYIAYSNLQELAGHTLFRVR